MDTSESFSIASKFQFREVFVFDRLPLKQDGVRLENEDEAKQLDILLEQAYIDLGYTPIRVPVVSITDRVTFIINHCEI